MYTRIPPVKVYVPGIFLWGGRFLTTNLVYLVYIGIFRLSVFTIAFKNIWKLCNIGPIFPSVRIGEHSVVAFSGLP